MFDWVLNKHLDVKRRGLANRWIISAFNSKLCRTKLVESLSSVLINCKVGWDGFFERELNMYISQIMRHVILQKIFFNFRRSLLKPSNNNIKKGMNITGFPTFIFQPLTSLHNALDYLTNNLLLLSRNPHFWTRFTGKLQILQTLHRPQSKLS